MQKKISGLVMKVDPPYVVIMTRDGHFLKERLQGAMPQVGEEIFLSGQEKPSRKSKLALVAVAAALIFLFLPFSILPAVLTAGKMAEVAWVTLDINPSLEYGVDRDLRVIRVNALNAEAERLIEGQNIMHQPIEEVIPLTVRRASELGFFHAAKENNILITVSSQDEGGQKQDQGLSAQLMEKASQVLESTNVRASVDVLVVPSELRPQAQEFNLSVGKYVIMLEGLQEGLPIEASHLQKRSIQSAIASAGGDFQKLVTQAKKEKDLKALEQKVKNKLPGKKKEDLQDKKTEEGNDKKGRTPQNKVEVVKRDHKTKPDLKGKTDIGRNIKSDNEKKLPSWLESALSKARFSGFRQEEKKTRPESSKREKDREKNYGQEKKSLQEKENKEEEKKSPSSIKGRRELQSAPHHSRHPGKPNNKGNKT
ncbi:MAG: anti-sigma factor domain-containing protein [Clostridia bacterium]|nr:anti-sigma factor domain-containing protein [Clostridia bacterium]